MVTSIPNKPYLMTSKFLKIIESDNWFYCYHSLFGNLKRIDKKYRIILDYFEQQNKVDNLFFLSFNSFERKELETVLIDFLDSYFIVSKEQDERLITKQYLKNREKQLVTGKNLNAIQLNISEGCNLACSYCFADRVDERADNSNNLARNKKKMMPVGIAIEAVDKILNLSERNQNDEVVIKFFGREPLLNWKAILSVVAHCKSIHTSTKFSYTITTNGTLITPEMADFFKANNFHIVVSVDGFPDSNGNRLTHRGGCSFAAVDIGLILLREVGVDVSVASVLGDFNISSLDRKFLYFLKDRGVKNWEIKLEMQNNSKINKNHTLVINKLLDLYKLGKDNGINVTGDWFDPFATIFRTRKTVNDPKILRVAPSSCSATDHQISVEPNGSLFGCRALDSSIGVLDKLDDVIKSPEYKNLAMRTYYNTPHCHGCKLEGFCQGVCIGHSEKEFGDIYQPDENYCKVYRGIFDLLIQSLEK